MVRARRCWFASLATLAVTWMACGPEGPGPESKPTIGVAASADCAPWQVPPIAMTALGGSLYVIEGQRLWQVNPATGDYVPRTPPGDPAPYQVPPIAMTALSGSLFVIENQTLWQVNPATGDYLPRTPASDPAPYQVPPIAMAALGGWLYVIENQRLWRVSPTTGDYVQIDSCAR